MRLTDAEEVRASIAAHILGAAVGGDALGSVTLHRHQVDAVSRLRAIVRQHGGALLADEVGLGKTFVALALASEFGRPVVVAPAALRSMWRDASQRTGVALRFVSMELLGHGGTVPTTGFIIVDEAHHFRNSSTNRYARLAAACSLSPVLLLSATPVQNRLDDLRTLMALIVGQRARALNTSDLAMLIVRRSAGTVGLGSTLPAVKAPQWVEVAPDVDCLDQICALPSPVPPSDGGLAATLFTFSLVRQWASSRAALNAALMRRLATARAMEDALATGRRLSRRELAAWRFADGAQQLAFPELAGDFTAGSSEMLHHVRLHADGLRTLLASLRYHPDSDRDRAAQLADIARRHPGERIIAFAQFSETVAALFRYLAASHRAAMLTHGGGRVAGGAVSRREVLSQFGVAASPPTSSRIDLLLTTDVLSEGVDLQSASVLVHLDLSWNPARMEQRVGRLRRPGAAKETVSVYLLAPPAPAERLLQLERRLRAKLGEASRAIGVSGTILPGIVPPPDSVVRSRETSLEVLRGWMRPGKHASGVASGVAFRTRGAIACVRRAGDVALVAIEGERVQVDPAADLLTEVSTAAPVTPSGPAVADALARVEAWLARGALAAVVQMPAATLARSRRRIIRRVDGIARRARRHERTSWSALLGAARRAATVTMPVGAERVLDQLAVASLPDDAWLRAVGEFGAIHGRSVEGQPDEVVALLLLVPG